MPLNPHYRHMLLCGLFTFILLILFGCDMRPTAMGYQHRIVIVADSVFWDEVKDDVEAAFETIVYTPFKEKNFYIKRIGLEELNNFQSRMNVFLLGTTSSDNEVDKYLRKQIPKEFIEGVDNGKLFYVFQNNLFVRDQLGLIMMAPSAKDFKERFSLLKEEIYQMFEEAYLKRLYETTYKHGSNEDIEDLLVDRFGWKVKVQHDYFIANHDTEDKFVWLRRIMPDRWLSIWEVPGDSAIFHQDSLFNIRDRITKKYYSGDFVVREDSYVIKSNFQNQSSTKIVGIWKNIDPWSGGPFRTYIVPDEGGKKFYFIDIAVHAPDKFKKPYLDQLEIMANSFEVVNTNMELNK